MFVEAKYMYTRVQMMQLSIMTVHVYIKCVPSLTDESDTSSDDDDDDDDDDALSSVLRQQISPSNDRCVCVYVSPATHVISVVWLCV